MRLRVPTWFPTPFDVSRVAQLPVQRRDRRIVQDQKWVLKRLATVDLTGRASLEFEYDVLADPTNFRANWIAIANHLQHIPKLGGSRGLELGSSVGMKMLIMQRFGARNLTGCDAVPSLIDDGRYWLAESGTTGIELVESAETSVPFSDGEFDWVTLQMVYCQLSSESIGPVVAEMFRVLRPGGLALIHDGANPRHEPSAQAMRDYYHEVEIGDGSPDSPSGPIHLMRRGYITATNPDLDPETIEALALGTAYMRQREIDSAVEAYRVDATLPISRFDPDATQLRPPLALDGQAVRRPTDPIEMADRFRAAGFEVRFQDSCFGGEITDVENHYLSDPSVFLIARRPD